MMWFKKIFAALTRGERLIFLAAWAGAIISFVVLMGILFTSVTTAVPAVGGEYAEGMVGQPEYVNPVIAASQTDLDLVKMVYSNIDDIADSIDVSTDTRTWTVHLKDGLTWQDGQKLTSDDVVFTVQSIQDPDAHSPLYAAWQGVAVSRVSELEVQFTLVNPYAFFADDLADLYILPKHLFADAPPGNWHLSDYNLKPVGSGPYKFVSYEKNSDGFISGYNLQAWNGNGAQPLIQNFDFQFFNDENTLVSSFNDGQIDGFGDASPEDISEIARPYDTFAWRTSGYYAVFFDTSQNIALQDPAVRLALSAALDRSNIVAQVFDGNAAPDFGPIPPGAAYFAPSAVASSSSLAPSLDFASTTLTNAGWVFPSASASSTASGTPSEFRAKTMNGVSIPLVVNLTVPQIDFLAKTATLLQSAWQSIGVQVNIMPDSADDIASQTIKNRNYESLLFGNVLGPSSDLYSFWDSSQRFDPGLNLAIYSNPKVDAAIQDAREQTSSTIITSDMATAQADIVNDNPAIFLYSPDYVYVTNKNVQGISTSTLLSDPSDRLIEVPAWYLETARVLK
jgi:peptide/nickel transport system substrate-binding protein